MKKFSEIFREQHREKGRFKPTIPRNVSNVAGASPRASSDSADVSLRERCWTGYRQIGMKKKGDKMVPNCIQDEKEVDIPKDAPTVESIAKKHGVSVDHVKKQLEMGMKVEAEHGKSKGSEREIALDHINEKPDYYTKLKKYVEDVSGKQEMQVQGTAAMTLTDKPNKEPMKKLKEASAAAIAAATAIAKKKSGNYDKEGMRVKPYKNPDAANVKSNAQRRKEMNEDVKKSNIPAILRKKRGDKPLTLADLRAARKDSISHPENLAKARNEEVVEEGAVPAKEKTVMVRHKTSGKELVVTAQKAKELQKYDYHPVKEEVEQHKEIYVHTEVEDGSHQDKNDTKNLHDRVKAAAKKHGATITYQDRPSLRGSHSIAARGSHEFHKEVKHIASDYEHLGAQHEVFESVEQIDEKNVPTSPEKWARAKAAAKSKFAVYPSAYANGWAAKKYKAMGGGWKSVSEETSWSKTGKEAKHAETGEKTYEYHQVDKEGKPTGKREYRNAQGKPMGEAKEQLPFEPDKPKKQSVVPGKFGAGYSTARHLARMAMQKQVKQMKKMPVKEETRKAAIVKEVMKKKKTASEDAFQKDPELSNTLTKV